MDVGFRNVQRISFKGQQENANLIKAFGECKIFYDTDFSLDQFDQTKAEECIKVSENLLDATDKFVKCQDSSEKDIAVANTIDRKLDSMRTNILIMEASGSWRNCKDKIYDTLQQCSRKLTFFKDINNLKDINNGKTESHQNDIDISDRSLFSSVHNIPSPFRPISDSFKPHMDKIGNLEMMREVIRPNYNEQGISEIGSGILEKGIRDEQKRLNDEIKQDYFLEILDKAQEYEINLNDYGIDHYGQKAEPANYISYINAGNYNYRHGHYKDAESSYSKEILSLLGKLDSTQDKYPILYSIAKTFVKLGDTYSKLDRADLTQKMYGNAIFMFTNLYIPRDPDLIDQALVKRMNSLSLAEMLFGFRDDGEDKKAKILNHQEEFLYEYKSVIEKQQNLYLEQLSSSTDPESKNKFINELKKLTILSKSI